MTGRISRRTLAKRALAMTLALEMMRRLNPPAAGAAALAAHLALRRAGRANSLTVHAGDLIGASPPISALARDEPSITSMGLLGVELGAVGNHEFDRGTAELLRLQDGGCDAAKRCFGGARMRYVAANVIDNATGGPIPPPYQVRTVDDVRIGFIGLTLRDTPTIVRPSGVAGLTFLDEVPAINRYAYELQAQGVNAIVVLIHQGGDGSVDGGPITGAEINRIANGIDPAVRVIVSGHTHRGYQGSIGDRLVTQAFSYGTALTDAEVVIDRESGRIVGATASRCSPRARTGRPDRRTSTRWSRMSRPGPSRSARGSRAASSSAARRSRRSGSRRRSGRVRVTRVPVARRRGRPAAGPARDFGSATLSPDDERRPRSPYLG